MAELCSVNSQSTTFWILNIIFVIFALVGAILIGAVIAKGPSDSNTILFLMYCVALLLLVYSIYLIRVDTIWSGILIVFQFLIYIGIFYILNDKGYVNSNTSPLYITGIVLLVFALISDLAMLHYSIYYDGK